MIPGRMGKVFVITGPSGVGKGTLIRELLQRVPDLELSVSATTRAPRAREENGSDYHFLTRAWGRFIGALFAWLRFSIMHTGWMALMAFLS